MPNMLEDMIISLNFTSKACKKSLSQVQGSCLGKRYKTSFPVVSRLQWASYSRNKSECMSKYKSSVIMKTSLKNTCVLWSDLSETSF